MWHVCVTYPCHLCIYICVLLGIYNPTFPSLTTNYSTLSRGLTTYVIHSLFMTVSVDYTWYDTTFGETLGQMSFDSWASANAWVIQQSNNVDYLSTLSIECIDECDPAGHYSQYD